MNFYTGLSTISTFPVLFSLFHLNLSNMRYRRGTSRHILKSNRKRKFTRSSRKILSYKDEFLLTLMKLRLGLLNEYLADRFGISPAICSSTFTTWIRLLRILLGDALVKWIPREAIRDNLPKVFKDTNHSKIRCIIYCTEGYIERLPNLYTCKQLHGLITNITARRC